MFRHVGLAVLLVAWNHHEAYASLELVLGQDRKISNPPNLARYFHCNETAVVNFQCSCRLTLRSDSNLVMDGGQEWSSGRPLHNDRCRLNANSLYMKNDGNLATLVGLGPFNAETEECWKTSLVGAVGMPHGVYVDGPESCSLHILRQIWTSRLGGLDPNYHGNKLDLVLDSGDSMSAGTLYHSSENDCKVELNVNNSELVVQKENTFIWKSGIQLNTEGGAKIVMESDGNLVINTGINRTVSVWASNTTGSGKHSLRIDEECNLSIFDEIWVNIRTELKMLDRMERGGKFTSSNYTLALEENGDLIQTDNEGSIIWSAGATTNEDLFFLSLNKDGRMVLSSVNDTGYEKSYWSEEVFQTNQTGLDYAIMLNKNGPQGLLIESTAISSTISEPSFSPSVSTKPSLDPSSVPSSIPSISPSASSIPSTFPTTLPSSNPSAIPSLMPSLAPSLFPSSEPTSFPSLEPSWEPSLKPSAAPSLEPSTFAFRISNECCGCLAPKGLGPGKTGCDTCLPCEKRICAVDDFCCDSGWDSVCASRAATSCNAGPSCVSSEELLQLAEALTTYKRPVGEEGWPLFKQTP